MADEVVEPTPPAPEEPKVEEPKKEAKPVKLDPNRPLTGQVDKLLKQIGPDDAKEAEAGDDDKKPAEGKEEAADADGDGTKPNDTKGDDAGSVGDKPGVEEVEEPDQQPVDLPPVAKYIYENLPNMQTIGHVGEGKDKVYNVKTPQELPEGFEFADKRTELIFSASIAGQEANARELQAKYNQEEQNNKILEYQRVEAIDIQKDIQSLQRENILPKFKYEETDSRFNDDPAVKEANAIYDVYKRTNEAYIKSGRTYRISFFDAADKYYASQARIKPKDEPKAEATKEREKVASRVGAPGGASPAKGKIAIPRGTDVQQIYQLYKQGRI